MALNPMGNNYNWNCTKPENEGFSDTLVGTVVAIQEVQARDYIYGSNQPGLPKFWPEGNPVFNIRMAFACPDGSLKTFTFPEAGKKQKSGEKPSVHMDMFHITGDTDMSNLIGKTLQIHTWPNNPTTGQAWGQGNPRLFEITELPNSGPYQLASPLPPEFSVPQVLADNAVSGGQVQQQGGVAPQNIQVPQQPIATQPMQQQVVSGPTQTTFSTQPTVAQPVSQPQSVVPINGGVTVMEQQATVQAQPETTINPMQPIMPAGMDPQVAAAMQGIAPANDQPTINTTPSVYDDGIPF